MATTVMAMRFMFRCSGRVGGPRGGGGEERPVDVGRGRSLGRRERRTAGRGRSVTLPFGLALRPPPAGEHAFFRHWASGHPALGYRRAPQGVAPRRPLAGVMAW